MPVEYAVPALRLGADHGRLDAARAALEDHAVAVDEEVVTDVVPAVGVAVVAGDAEHDPGRFLGRVVDRGDRVVDERGLHGCRSSGALRGGTWSAPQAARGTIAGAPPACAARARGARARGRARTKRTLRPRGAAAQAQLQLVGGAGEDGVGAADACRGWRAAASSASSGRRAVRARTWAWKLRAAAPSAGRRGRSGAAPAARAVVRQAARRVGAACRAARARTGAGAGGGERGGGDAQRAERGGARAEAQRLAAGEAMDRPSEVPNTAWPRSERLGALNAIFRRGENGNEFQ